MQARRLASLAVAAVVLSGCGGSGNGGGSSGTGAQMYAVGGTLSGVSYGNGAGGPQLILFLNGEDAISHPANGKFTFSQKLAAGASYAVTAQVSLLQPYQTCTVSNSGGTAGPSSATAVSVACTRASFSLSGTVSGLSGAGLVLSDGSENLPVSANGAFQFNKPLPSGTQYTVTVVTQPSSPPQTCSITTSNGRGQVTNANIPGVQVVCNTNTFSLGGSVSGLTGAGLTLSVSAINTLTPYVIPVPLTASVPVTANGSFTVPGFMMATGYEYVVSAATMPTGQTCLVPDGSGTVANASVTVTVVCAAPRFAYAPGVHGNNLLGYAVSFSDGALTPLPGSPYAAGDSTTALALDPTDRFLFAANQGATGGVGSNTISAYSIDAGTGALTPVAGSPFAAATAPVALAVAPSGKYLYVADYHDNTISAFAIGPTGALTPVSGGPVVAGVDGPRGLTMLPNGKVLYLSASNDGSVYSYAIDGVSGALTALPASPLAAPGGPGPVQLLLDVTESPTNAFALWVYTAPLRGFGGSVSLALYTFDLMTGAFGTNYAADGGEGLLPLPDFAVADPEGRIFYLVGRPAGPHTGNDQIQPTCLNWSCSSAWNTLFPLNAQATGAVVDPSGRFLYLTDTAGNALPFLIDRVRATLTAGTVTAGAFRPNTSVVLTTQ